MQNLTLEPHAVEQTRQRFLCPASFMGTGQGYPVSMMLQNVVRTLWSWVQAEPCGFLRLPWWPLFDRAVFALLATTAALLAPVGCILIGEQWKRRTVAGWRTLWLFGGFALTYVVLLIVVISLLVGVWMGGKAVWPRFLSLLYIPLLIAGVFVLDRILGYERERRLSGNVGSLPIVRTMMPGRKGSVLAAIVTIVLSLGLVRQAVPAASVIMVGNCHYQYLGFNGPRWVGSEVLRYARTSPVAGEIYSNAPWPLSLHNGGKGGKNMNRHHVLRGSRTALERQFAERIPDGAYVIWFDHYDRHHDYGESDLWRLPDLEPVAELADGVVFKVTRDDVPRSSP